MNQDLVVSVTLEQDPQGHPYLMVDKGHQQLEFREKTDDPHGQAIVWTLKGNASGGEFCALDAHPPGFTWGPDAPRAGIFIHLKLAQNTLRIVNHHIDPNTEGLWCYQLSARFGDRVVQTLWTPPKGGAERANPSIKNT